MRIKIFQFNECNLHYFVKVFCNLKRFLGYIKISQATQKYWHDLFFTADIFGKKWENPQFRILSLVHEKY